MTQLSRRSFIAGLGAGAACLSMPGIASSKIPEKHLVIGAGPNGLDQALKLVLETPDTDVTLVDRHSAFFGGYRSPLAPKAIDLDKLKLFVKSGGQVKQSHIVELDPERGHAMNNFAGRIKFDQVHTHAGMVFKDMDIEGLDTVLHGWSDHVQANQLWEQVVNLKEGGVVVITKPKGAMRFETGPYLRANIISNFLSQHNPGAKVVLVDASCAMKPENLLCEWVSGDLLAIKGSEMTSSAGKISADVLNIIPEQKPFSFS